MLAASYLLSALVPSVVGPWDYAAQDLLFRLRATTGWGLTPRKLALVYVGFSDESLSGPDRTEYAEVVRGLAALGVQIQIHDAIFPGEDTPALAAAVAEAGNVVIGTVAGLHVPTPAVSQGPWRLRIEGDVSLVPDAARPRSSFAPLRRTALGDGFLDLAPDRDGTVRRAPLLARGADGFHPSLALVAACALLDVGPDDIVLRPGRELVLRGARLGRGESADLAIPIDRRAAVLLDWRRPWTVESYIPAERVRLAATDLDERRLLKSLVADKPVIVADFTPGSDVVATPLDMLRPGAGVHGQVLDSILSGAHLRDAYWWEELAAELLCAAGLLWAVRANRTVRVITGIAAVCLACFAVAGASFLWGSVLPTMARPSLLLSGGAATLLVQRYVRAERQRAVLRITFEAYFAPQLARRLLEHPERVTRSGERKELTILFSDIAGFTRRAADMEARDVQAMLNHYFEAMVEIAFQHGGTVDKFIGDGLMVFFGDPDVQPDHAGRAVRCAVAMQRRVRELNRSHPPWGPLSIRIGIYTGLAVVGNLGSPRRLAYTVVGDTVNRASRLESEAPVGGILLSAETHAAVDGEISARRVGPVRAKNLEPMWAYQIDPDAPALQLID